MSATATDRRSTEFGDDRILGIRIPAPMARELEAAAARDQNPLSAVVRRLISAGLRAERRDI